MSRLGLGDKAWGRRLTLAGLLLVVSVAAGFVISPGLYSQQIPALTEDHLGKPFRANSPAGFKAARDYDIVYSAMTEQRRQEARNSVRPVYDLNPEVVDQIRGAVKAAFAQMRKHVAAKPPQDKVAGGEAEAEVRKDGKAAEVRKAKKPAAPTPEEMERQRREREVLQGDFQEQLFGQRDTAVETEDFHALLANGFSRRGRGGHAGAAGAGVRLGAGAAVHRRLARGADARGPPGHHRPGCAPQRRADAAGQRRPTSWTPARRGRRWIALPPSRATCCRMLRACSAGRCCGWPSGRCGRT